MLAFSGKHTGIGGGGDYTSACEVLLDGKYNTAVFTLQTANAFPNLRIRYKAHEDANFVVYDVWNPSSWSSGATDFLYEAEKLTRVLNVQGVWSLEFGILGGVDPTVTMQLTGVATPL